MDIGSQPGGVDQRQDVVLDKPTAITILPGQVAKQVFPTGKRAGQVQYLYRNAPGHGGQVQPHHPGPFQGEQAAEQHEQDEGQVKQHEAVGGESVEHWEHVEKRGKQSKGLLAG